MCARSVSAAFVVAGLCAVAAAGCKDSSSKRDRPAAGSAESKEKAARWIFGQPLPGAVPFDAKLITRLKRAWKKRPDGYRPRTRHRRSPTLPEYTNRLFLEKSPYLRQHAHNPVNWFPWGEEAFRLATELGRPILLSVGYSTCHWCHVMEKESFEDEAIARYLNANYVAIKVDREERPDVDAIYMRAIQLMRGSGGWPMTVWLTPDGRPFYGASYLPPRAGVRGAPVGFLTMLRRLKRAYDEHPMRIVRRSTALTEAVQKQRAAGDQTSDSLSAAPIHALIRHYRLRFDRRHGGLRGAPKFPGSLSTSLLLRYHRRQSDKRALQMVETTLTAMARGGIHDQIGGGFHRYSTDELWRVPHFEMMLYDNARLALAYLEGYQATGEQRYAEVARRTLRYLSREMTAPSGAFYAATDADSLAPDGELEEGYFFSWTPAELRGALGDGAAELVAAHYGVGGEAELEGRHVLYVAKSVAELAKRRSRDARAVAKQIAAANETLYRVRAKRPAPLRDDKIITAWNGLAISAFARAALVLGEPELARRAARAADFVLTQLTRDGRLLRRHVAGRAAINGYLDDYAFSIAGLLDLYEATSTLRWLREAIALDEVLRRHFEDAKSGGYFLTSDDAEQLIARTKPALDGARPSGNAVEAMNLLRLHELTTRDRYRRRAVRLLSSFAKPLARSPGSMSKMVEALERYLDRPKQVIIVTPKNRAEAEPLLARLREIYLPNRVLAVVSADQLSAQAKLIPLLKDKVARGGKPTAYVCERGSCKWPTTDPTKLARQLATTVALPSPKD